MRPAMLAVYRKSQLRCEPFGATTLTNVAQAGTTTARQARENSAKVSAGACGTLVDYWGRIRVDWSGI